MKAEGHSLAAVLAQARASLTYQVEGSILEFTEELVRLMTQEGMSKTGLAKRLGCQPAFVTKLLSGQNNFTIETMVKVARVFGAQVKIHLQEAGVESQWVDLKQFTVSEEATATSTVVEGRSGARKPQPVSAYVSEAPRATDCYSKVRDEELALAA